MSGWWLFRAEVTRLAKEEHAARAFRKLQGGHDEGDLVTGLWEDDGAGEVRPRTR